MAEATKRTAAYADLEAVPPHLVAEILYGDPVTHPRPTRRHGGATSRLAMILGNPFDLGVGGPRGWISVIEPELHLGPHFVVPDIAGWRRERVREPADKAFFEVAPDWVCGAISPRAEKFALGLLWPFDPPSTDAPSEPTT